MTLAPGTRLGHYGIVGKLGAGGMGEVWRATDTKLGRDVALKVLPAEMTSDPDRIERFQREARALAALDHPGIVTVYSVEEADGVHFLTMQLVDGQPLDRLIPAGGMPLERIVAIGTALAEALAVAHDKGIVHRDLKPANVMVTTDGRVKVLDFGLAKIAEAGAEPEATVSHALTQQGAVMGTMPYMSPEQVSGRPVDQRTDVFALGVVLYEMATGRRPFLATSSAELASEILRDAPPSVGDVRRDLPAGVGRVISRCLEKDRLRRFQTARDVGNELADLARSASASRLAGAADSGAVRVDEGFWIAVQPFKHRGTDPGIEALAEGLSEDIVTGLSRFSYLRVVARGAAAAEPRYLMDGSLRQAGARLRIAVQLLDTTTGAHLWAESYERAFTTDTVFDLQDDLTPRIVSTIADFYGVLPRSMSEAVRSRPPDQLSPYEAVLRSFSYFERVTAEELDAARSALEGAVRKAPTSADAWAMLALLSAQEYGQGFRLLPDPLGAGASAARRAVEAGPSNALAHFSLAQVLFFQKDFQAFRNEAERAAALNPMDGNALAFLGELLTYAGDSERGLALSSRAKQLNPNHPGWYWYADFFHLYRRREYPAALAVLQKVNLPGHWGLSCATAATCGQLGQWEAGEKAVRRLLELRPDIADVAPREFAKWWDAELTQHMIDGLRKAGLDVSPGSESGRSSPAAAAPRSPSSGAACAQEGCWVAVLPFTGPVSDPELQAIADGLGEDVTTGLSRFSHLFVISRNSAMQYAGRSLDVRAVGRELGARFVLEGNVRRAASTVRVSVKLLDAATGTHLWTETFDRDLAAADIFAVQDYITDRVVATVADPYGVLVRAMAAAVRDRPVAELSAKELVLRVCAYWHQIRPDEHARLRAALEHKLEREPMHAEVWACLSRLYSNEHEFRLNPLPESVERACKAAQRAVEIDPTSQMGWEALAEASYFGHDLGSFRNAADRAMALNPRNTSTAALMGVLISHSGEWERGCEITRGAMALNPHHPGWYRFPLFFDHYRKREYREALETAKQLNMPEDFWVHAVAAAASGRLGLKEEARAALASLRRLLPGYRDVLRPTLGLWILDTAVVEQVMAGLAEAEALIGEPPLAAKAIDAASTSHPAGSPSPTADSRSGGVSIAVLPFADLSAAKDLEYLCEGMAEEIMTALVRVEGIRVASRTSAFRARDEGRDLADIARLLSVGHLLEGSVRTAGGRLRVSAQLTDATTGYQLWSERFDRDATDVFAIQDEIAAGVVEAVKARLGPGHQAVAARPQVANVEAYRLYLRARHLRYTKNDHGGALRCFERVLELDPTHAPSWVGLAEIKVLVAFYGVMPALEAYAAARGALATAAGLQGESAAALHVEGMIAAASRDWQAAQRLLRRAVAIDPSNVPAWCWLGVVATFLRRDEEAELALARARDLDPLSPFPHAMTGLCLLGAGRVEDAVRHQAQAQVFDPENVLALWGEGVALTALGRSGEGIAALERALGRVQRGMLIHALLGWAYAVAGRTTEARTVLAELRQRAAPAPALVGEAWLLAAVGDTEAAWEVLGRAESERQLLLLFTGMPGFDPLRADPRWTALLGQLDVPAAAPSSGKVPRP